MPWTELASGLINKWWIGSTVLEADVDGAFQFVGAKDETGALINWVDRATPGISVDSPTWTREDGFTFDGIDDAIDSGITLATSATVLILVTLTLDGENDRIFGYTSGTSSQIFRFRIDRENVIPNLTGNIGGVAPSASVTLEAGVDYVFGATANSRERLWLDGEIEADETVGSFNGGGGNAYIGGVNNAGVLWNNPWGGPIKAVAIYNRELTQAEIQIITAQMKAITTTTNLSQYVNYISQNPATKHINKASHELLIATEAGIYQTFNKGSSWAKLPLPDPSNAEFGDSPAATVDELSFRWIDYDPLTPLTYYAMALKSSVNRVWLYKTTDGGSTWTSRGVELV